MTDNYLREKVEKKKYLIVVRRFNSTVHNGTPFSQQIILDHNWSVIIYRFERGSNFVKFEKTSKHISPVRCHDETRVS